MLHSTRSRPRSKLGNMTTSSSGRVSCLGIISPRSATLLLALLGCVAHIQQFNYLSNLHDSFPHVPKVRSLPPTTISGNDYVTPPTVTPAAELPKSYIHAVTNIDESLTHTDAVTSIASTSAIYNLASPNVKGKNGSLKSTSKEAAAALAKPARWFNLLPSRFPQNDSKSANVAAASSIPSGFVEQDWKARQRDQEEDRKSWEAARSLTLIVRLYALICAVMCLCGVIGVLRSSLLCTRLFVLSSTLDLILCALSLVSLGIIITYPNIRGLICEELSSTSAVIMELDQASGSSTSTSRGPAMLLGHAASTFWKRTMSKATNATTDSLPHTYWWDSMLDNLLEYENCDDVLESVIIPLGLIISLVYLALRIHFLVVIRNFYISLIRSQMSYHLSTQAALPPSSKNGERKYSSSSTSSTASTSELIPCLPTAIRNLRMDARYMNEKMA